MSFVVRPDLCIVLDFIFFKSSRVWNYTFFYQRSCVSTTAFNHSSVLMVENFPLMTSTPFLPKLIFGKIIMLWRSDKRSSRILDGLRLCFHQMSSTLSCTIVTPITHTILMSFTLISPWIRPLFTTKLHDS